MSTNALMHIVVNGDQRPVPERQTISQLLAALDLDPARVAVELDRHIVKPKDWATTELADGARLEIVQFVGGG